VGQRHHLRAATAAELNFSSRMLRGGLCFPNTTAPVVGRSHLQEIVP
jgi:hypothetical protein